MNILLLGLILAWCVFWIGYTVHSLNQGRFFYRYRRFFTRQEHPVLFHAELFVSIMWALAGYAALFMFLRSSL